MAFERTGFVQIGILTRDIKAATEKWAAFLKLPPPEPKETAGHGVTGALYKGKPAYGHMLQAAFRIGNLEIEFIEPTGEGGSVWQEDLEHQGEGLHHIAFSIRGMKESVEAGQKLGYPLIQSGQFQGGCYSYLDAAQDMKVILELLEFDGEKAP
jgi:catechol 2,3-dioxygenase-like lactoylglutathione lyase family enzyme